MCDVVAVDRHEQSAKVGSIDRLMGFVGEDLSFVVVKLFLCNLLLLLFNLK